MNFNESIVISGFLNQEEREILFKSEPMKIGKTYWIAVVLKDLKFDLEREKKLNEMYGTDIGNGIYNIFCFYKEGDYFKSHWADMREHPNYDFNDGTFAGLPKTLVKLYEKYKTEIKSALNGNTAAQSSLF